MKQDLSLLILWSNEATWWKFCPNGFNRLIKNYTHPETEFPAAYETIAIPEWTCHPAIKQLQTSTARNLLQYTVRSLTISYSSIKSMFMWNSYSFIFLQNTCFLVNWSGDKICKKNLWHVTFLLMRYILSQVVIVSGHLDSWDVGQGAMDDGGGAFISWEALSLIRDLGKYL